MSRMVFCQLLKKDAPGLDAQPYPGELGQDIFTSISQEAWTKWLNHLTMLINENRLSTADPRHLDTIEQQMREFLFPGK
ncbi:MAG: oxidative damage protection protein [Gammaproteobacteria bacterium]|nr:oxidative damage protection protein [Gammaproteobacteria bacterium]